MKYCQDLINTKDCHNLIVDDNLLTERETKDNRKLKEGTKKMGLKIS